MEATISSALVLPGWRMKFVVLGPTPPEPPRDALAVEGRPSFFPL